MMLFLAPTCVPWKTQKEWIIYRIFYKIPHSFLILFFVPRSYKKIYAFHILCDILSHTGEWSIQPFYPISDISVHGIWDPINWV